MIPMLLEGETDKRLDMGLSSGTRGPASDSVISEDPDLLLDSSLSNMEVAAVSEVRLCIVNNLASANLFFNL